MKYPVTITLVIDSDEYDDITNAEVAKTLAAEMVNGLIDWSANIDITVGAPTD